MKKLSITIILVMILEIISFVFTIPESKARYSSDEATQKVNESVAYAMSLLDNDLSDYDKAIILAQYVQEGTLYRYADHDQTAEGILVDHEAVCAGYADAFQLLTNTAGIVTEQMNSAKAAHQWNIMLIDGVWSYSDTVENGGRARHQCTNSRLFMSQLEYDYIIYNGGYYQGSTAPPEAIENGESQYFSDSRMTNHDSDLPYMDAQSVDVYTGYQSRLYIDDDYKYYVGRDDDDFSIKYLYKENRKTGQKETLADMTYEPSGIETNIVKDGDYIYYVGKDLKSIYQIKTDGTDNKKVYDNSSNGKLIVGVYVSDGYMYYTTAESVTSREYEYVQYKKLQNAVTTGTYNVNTSTSKYTLEYIKSSRGITISKCVGINGAEPSGEIYIPDTIDGLPVIGIGIEAFKDTNLTGVLKLPKDVEYISDSAFQNTKIQGIEFNDKIKYIGFYAFKGCSEITGTLTLPDSLQMINEQGFADCSGIDKIDLGNGIKRIGNSAFNGVDKVKIIEVPESVEYLDGNSFAYMTGLKAAILPESLKMYSADTFIGCNNLTDVWLKSENIEAMTGNDKVNLYLPTNTETSRYADENGIKYISDSEININNAQVNIKNVTTGEENITNIELQPNEKIILEANISPAFWCEEKVTWESADTSIAEINENGELTAKADGNTTITAKISGKSKTVNIKVENLETVQFDNPDMTIEKGSSTTLKIIGGVDEDSNITWKVKTMANPNKEYDINNIAIMRYLKVEKTSDNREVKVTSVDTEADNNKYQIIAYVDGTDYYGICDVTIGIPVDMIRIGPVSTGISISSNGVEESLEIDYNNEETKNFELALRLYPDNHTEEVPETVWTVENPSVIQHNGNGKFTVLRGGTTVVTAKAGKYERKITITINGDTEHVLLGDVDQSGKVTATDGFLTYDIYLHEEELEPDVFTAADVDKSGKVTATDAFIIYDAYLHEIVL